MWKKYADLLVQYCLDVKQGERVLVESSYIAEPLLQEVYASILRSGGNAEFAMSFQDQGQIFYEHATKEQLDWVSPLKKHALEQFECRLSIMAPFNLRADQNVDMDKRKRAAKALKPLSDIYMRRTGNGEMKRSLCLFPTNAGAQEAGMSLKEYEQFVFNACYLNHDNPVDEWLKVRAYQDKIAGKMNNATEVKYQGPNIDISFNTSGRKWINSDGRNNMPSGEVYTSPVEESVNGWVNFTFPSIYNGREVKNVRLEVKEGVVVDYSADSGIEILDEVFSTDGARMFGECAIGTNKQIDRITKNILFDEKIGGTIHMAVGQSYFQAGGKNESSVHWDMITDMTDGGQILADGEKVYENGEFIFS